MNDTNRIGRKSKKSEAEKNAEEKRRKAAEG